MSDTSSDYIAQKEEYHNIISYIFKWCPTDGIVYNIQLNLKDDTREKRVDTRQIIDKTSGNIGDINSYMTKLRTLAGVKANLFSSNFELEHNHTCGDNEFYESQDDYNNLDNNNKYNLADTENIDIEQPNPRLLVLVNNANKSTNDNMQTDIRSQQEISTKQYSALTLS